MQEKTKQKKWEREREKGRETDTSKWRPLTVRLRAPRYDCVLRNMTTFSFGIFSFLLSFFAFFFCTFLGISRAFFTLAFYAICERASRNFSHSKYLSLSYTLALPVCLAAFMRHAHPFVAALCVLAIF